MTVQEFKDAYGINSITFRQSTKSKRLVATTHVNGTECQIITRSDYDSQKDGFIYKNSILADTDGVLVENLYWLSNKAGEVVMTL